MIQLEKARALAEKYPIRPGTETVSLEEAMGRVLAEDVHADRDAPPFPRATMDGYACRHPDPWRCWNRSLPGASRPLKWDRVNAAGS